jgi:uroporphyrinogen-III synthase
VTNVTAYHTAPDLEGRDEVQRLLHGGEIDVVTFTSSSTVRNLVASLENAADLLGTTFVACIGPVTAATARELGLRVDLVADVHTIDGLVSALVAALPQSPRPVGVP